MSGPVAVGIHDVERITIEERLHNGNAECHEFVVVRIKAEMRDGLEPLVVDLFMNKTKLCVRQFGTSIGERIIEVVR